MSAAIETDPPLICGTPDAVSIGHRPLLGSGNWPGCHGRTDYHSAKVFVDTSLMPAHVERNWHEIWRRVVAAYKDVGLILQETLYREDGNIAAEFVTRTDGWIGLAVIGQGQSCDDQIWCKYNAAFTGGTTNEAIINQWTSLFLHELGHNSGLPHSNGGIMNPSLIPGLPPTWRGDPSERTLRQLYGGEAPPTPKPPEGDDLTGLLEQLLKLVILAISKWLDQGGLQRLDRALEQSEVANSRRQ